MNWQMISSQAVHLRSWEDEFVVYNSVSGDTHLLGWAAGHILMQLQKRPVDEGSLCAFLCEGSAGERDPELSLQVQQILGDLRKLMLIEEAP